MSTSPFHVEEDPEDESWLMTYADAITNLMAFFIMLAAMSTIDMPAYEKAAASIKSEIGNTEVVSPTELMKIDLQDVIYTMQANAAVTVGTDNKGIVLEMDSSAFYQVGSADIRPEAVPVLEKIAKTVMSPRYANYVLEVEGHTDDDPISTPTFPSNWELSVGRASRVVRFLTDSGMEADRLKASGFGASRPVLPNRTAAGAPIPQNQAKNRRVVIKIYPVTADERQEQQLRSTMVGDAEGDPAISTSLPAPAPVPAPLP